MSQHDRNTVHVDRRGEVVVATIDVPARHNAADLGIYRGLEEALAVDAAAYVITGANGDFSAGDDVRMFGFGDVAAADRFIVDVSRLFQAIERHERAVVAAVDGYALGFGFELALACDVTVATPRAVFGLPEIRHGAAPPNAMGRGPQVLGRGLIRHLAVSGTHWLSGVEAHALGLVAELAEPDDLVDRALGLAIDISRRPEAVLCKRLLTARADETYRLAPVVMGPLMATADVARSRDRFAEGRR
jgi:enoyl-CoA hydratase/carnithine racemase